MSGTPKLLIVEDSRTLAETYEAYLAPLDAEIALAADLKSARSAVAETGYDVILLDVKLPDGDGLDLLDVLPKGDDMPRIIVMTAHGSISVAVAAMRAGAADFIVKPFDKARLLTTVRNALEHRRLVRLVHRYERNFRHEGYGEFLGSSPAMQAVYRMIDNAAPSKASVFITGESGTGKELCARALHQRSPRREGPFIALNCAALPKDLIESEIFGHRQGAFTGATSSREGAAVRADGGTLFLDEICEMDLALQGKLLRFLQTGMVQPVGADEARPVDVRILCATNRDPQEEVSSGRFREDLFYRLHVIPIELPPLRERGEDAAELAQAFLQQLAAEEHKSFERLSDEARRHILAYPWPGNVRELRNVIQTAVVLNDGPVLEATMLPAHIRGQGVPARPGSSAPSADGSDPVAGSIGIEPLWKVEKRVIEHAIAACNGNISRAAALLEVAPSTLYRKLQSWNGADKASGS